MENSAILKKVYIIWLIIIIALIICICLPIIWYNSSVKPMSKDSEPISVEIEMGASSDKIANELIKLKLIRNKLAFKIYVKLNNISNFQAGKYELNKNMDLKTIVEILQTGKIEKEQLSITFIEGKNMRWIANTIEQKTNNSKEDVFNLLKDKEYINTLIEEYFFLTDEINNKEIYYPLEGYLFPDTYFFEDKDVTVKTIFKTMLDKMGEVLSSYDLKNSKYTYHELLTLASIVELEGTGKDARKDVASVLYNRLNSNMALGSDVTTYYAFKIDIGERDLTVAELNTYNAYNTRGPKMSGKLPIGPICSPSKSSIAATINPNETKYLYFVADKNGKMYFSKSLSDHTKTVTNLKKNGLWYEY